MVYYKRRVNNRFQERLYNEHNGQTIETLGGTIMRKIAKDKLYHLATSLGDVNKTDLHIMLDVSDTALRKWSYNPLNVGTSLSDAIFKRIAYLDLLRVNVKCKSNSLYKVTYRGGYSITNDYRTIVASLLNRVEFVESRYIVDYSDQNVEKVMKTGRLSMIAHNKSLEIPPGVTVWNGKFVS